MYFNLMFWVSSYALASYWLERQYPGEWALWNQTLGLLVAAFYVWRLSIRNRAAVLTSFFQIYSWFGMLVSAFAIATGIYMTEIEQVGSANGSFWVLFIFFVLGMWMTLLGYRASGRSSPLLRFSQSFQKLILLLVTTPTILLSAYVFVRYQGPALLGLARTEFWGTVVPSSLRFIPNLINQTYFFPSYAYFDAKSRKTTTYLGIFLIASYAVITIFVLGEKFTAGIVFANAFLFVLAAKFPNFRFRTRHVVLSGSLAAFVLTLIAYTYVRQGQDADFLITRIALQAQLMWSTMEDGSALRLMPTDASCFLSCGEFTSGREYISWLYLPESRFIHYQNVNSQLSGFTPALHLQTLGWAITLPAILLMMFLMGWVQKKGVQALSQRNLIYGFLIFKLHFGLTVFVATANMVTMTGIMFSLCCIVIYRLCFSSPARPVAKST